MCPADSGPIFWNSAGSAAGRCCSGRSPRGRGNAPAPAARIIAARKVHLFTVPPPPGSPGHATAVPPKSELAEGGGTRAARAASGRAAADLWILAHGPAGSLRASCSGAGARQHLMLNPHLMFLWSVQSFLILLEPFLITSGCPGWYCSWWPDPTKSCHMCSLPSTSLLCESLWPNGKVYCTVKGCPFTAHCLCKAHGPDHVSNKHCFVESCLHPGRRPPPRRE